MRTARTHRWKATKRHNAFTSTIAVAEPACVAARTLGNNPWRGGAYSGAPVANANGVWTVVLIDLFEAQIVVQAGGSLGLGEVKPQPHTVVTCLGDAVGGFANQRGGDPTTAELWLHH